MTVLCPWLLFWSRARPRPYPYCHLTFYAVGGSVQVLSAYA
jgi:hypothetical protein